MRRPPPPPKSSPRASTSARYAALASAVSRDGLAGLNSTLGARDDLLLTFGSVSLASFVTNWVESLRAAGEWRLLVGALDDEGEHKREGLGSRLARQLGDARSEAEERAQKQQARVDELEEVVRGEIRARLKQHKALGAVTQADLEEERRERHLAAEAKRLDALEKQKRETRAKMIADTTSFLFDQMASKEEGITLKTFKGILGMNSMVAMATNMITSIQISSIPVFQL